MDQLGLYIHVPFCAGKCPYCDFYSVAGGDEEMDAYLARVEVLLAQYAKDCGRALSTVYFGGGTPSLLGVNRLSRLLDQVGKRFTLAEGAEITLEANPTSLDQAFFTGLHKAGWNRLSLGMQSADPGELKLLGRGHTARDVARAVELARLGGFRNLSLDLMLGLPGGGEEKLGRSIQFAAGLKPEHISAYILKVEPGTPFSRQNICLPDEDQTAEEYLFCVRELASQGYAQYEISNFSKPGRESRHNLLYWRCQEYIGIGPGAHSFYQGRRFFWPRDLKSFLSGGQPADDGPGGSIQEFAMLNLRLTAGLRRSRLRERYGQEGEAAFQTIAQKASACPAKYLAATKEAIALTPEGFLISNALLCRLLD